MPQFLFVVEVPPTEGMATSPGHSYVWRQFANTATEIVKPLKGTKQLQLNAWLLNAENSLPSILELSALASHHKLSYSTVLIPDGAVVFALEESLSISRKALSNSRLATRIAISAIVLSIIMAIQKIIEWSSK